MIPIHLLAREAAGIRAQRTLGTTDQDTRGALRQRTILQWQDSWDNSSKGRWTHRLIPDLKSWLNRSHGQVEYHLTQLLTGHGCFKAYLHRFKHENDPFCVSAQAKQQGQKDEKQHEDPQVEHQHLYLVSGALQQRQFANPISYLGGPRLQPRSNRNSIDSILSLD
ncbi:GL22936 [Drosophila persimilis]|uniref:GL22936 n=1 Tax=Drosophila persimilis TaxID=7234 RepID=B4HCY6_DROPE|nr:GL22936 [Drosophila persimilis]